MDWSQQINSNGNDGFQPTSTGSSTSGVGSKRQKVSMTPSRRPKSLFGAVMESAEKTIKRKNYTNHSTTTTGTTTGTTSSTQINSPIIGGGLFNLLQNVNQDFLSLPNHTTTFFSNEKEEPTSTITTTDTSSTKKEQVIWNEYPLYYNNICTNNNTNNNNTSNNTTSTLDWSLKHKCKLDYSYPSSSSSHFLLQSTTMDSSFQYWQHPSNSSSLPSSHYKKSTSSSAASSTILSRTSSILSSSRLSSSRLSSTSTITPTTITDKNKKKQQEEVLIPHLISSVRTSSSSSSSSRTKKNVLLTFSQQLRLSSNLTSSHHQNNSNHNHHHHHQEQQQRWEWKECLYTLFYNRYWSDSSKFYFYALTKHQTILFRRSSHDQKQPMILLSSCHNIQQLSSKQFNITFHTYNHQTHQYEPTSTTATSNNNDNDNDRNSKEDSPHDKNNHPLQSEVEEELEDLRRATVNGNMVGEEYFISTQSNKKRDTSAIPKNKDPPSFVILGEEDCLAFFEYYYNTYGGTQQEGKNDDNEDKEDLPLLMYPYTFGPSSFMTLKSLSVIKKQPQQNDDGVQHASIEIRGPIMPCTLQCILSNMAKQLVQHKRNNSQQKNGDSINNNNHGDDDDAIIQNLLKTGQGSWLSYPEEDDHDDDGNDDSQTTTSTNQNVGSHYFVCNLQTYGTPNKNRSR